MDDVYAEHTVSVKIALYSHDFQKVLVMQYPQNYGLPGGHLEANELPDEALVRELHEELGIAINSFQKKDFFLRSGRGSSVILGYIGIAPASIVLQPSNPVKETGVWMTKDEIDKLSGFSEAYKNLVIENWPTN